MVQGITKTRHSLKTSLCRSSEVGKPSHPKRAMVIPAANVDETENEYILTIASPGFKRGDFQIMIESEILTITAAKKELPLPYINDRCEYNYSHWKRIFSLPDDAEALLARAQYRDGELIIRIPRGKTDNSTCSSTIYVY
jgi:HSP20 family molecular chaperone IbpA